MGHARYEDLTRHFLYERMQKMTDYWSKEVPIYGIKFTFTDGTTNILTNGSLFIKHEDDESFFDKDIYDAEFVFDPVKQQIEEEI